MYKAILEPNLGYGDVNYNEACIEAFHQRNAFNIMPAQPYWKLLKDRREKNFPKNQAWNLPNFDVGTGKFAYFIRFLKKNKPVYLFNLILTKNSNYDMSSTNITFPTIIFFHPLFRNGSRSLSPKCRQSYTTQKIWTRKLRIWSHLLKKIFNGKLPFLCSLSFSKKKFSKFIRPSPNSVLIATTAKESDTSQNYALFQII